MVREYKGYRIMNHSWLVVFNCVLFVAVPSLHMFWVCKCLGVDQGKSSLSPGGDDGEAEVSIQHEGCFCFLKRGLGNSLAVQWLGLRASMVGGTGSIPGQGTKIPRIMLHGQKKKRNRERTQP